MLDNAAISGSPILSGKQNESKRIKFKSHTIDSKVNQLKDTISFGRALATEKAGEKGEISIYSQIIQAAKKNLGSNNVMVIMPSVSTPQETSKNTGMGTLFSDYAQESAGFLKRMIGMSAIQDMPQGQFGDKGNVSPFSGSVNAICYFPVKGINFRSGNIRFE